MLESPAVVKARRCGPVTVPNHKLIADVRWILDANEGPGARAQQPAALGPRLWPGVEIVVTGGHQFVKHPAYGPFDQDEDSPLIQVPGPGYQLAVVERYFSAYVRC